MNHLSPPFDRNSITTYLHEEREACVPGKGEDHAETIECDPRAGEDLPRSVHQSPRLYPPIHATASGQWPSLLLPSQGAPDRGSIAVNGENSRRPPRGKGHHRSLRH